MVSCSLDTFVCIGRLDFSKTRTGSRNWHKFQINSNRKRNKTVSIAVKVTAVGVEESKQAETMPIRVLCLHGKGENGDSFRSRTAFLTTTGSKGVADKEIQFDYINAPHDMGRGGSSFEWWKLPPGERSFTATEYRGVDDTLALVQKTWEDRGPYQGVLGFSQGAMLAAVIAAKSLADPEFIPKPKFAIVFSAAFPLPFEPLLSEVKNVERVIPTLHVIGKADHINPPDLALRLAECFQGAEVKWHSEPGHVVPSLETVATMCQEFCIKHA